MTATSFGPEFTARYDPGHRAERRPMSKIACSKAESEIRICPIDGSNRVGSSRICRWREGQFQAGEAGGLAKPKPAGDRRPGIPRNSTTQPQADGLNRNRETISRAKDASPRVLDLCTTGIEGRRSPQRHDEESWIRRAKS
jgi:hypothetical protein